MLLVFISVFVGLGWSYFWLKWSQETVRLAEMSRINESLGRHFIDDLSSLRKKNIYLKASSLESVRVSLKNSLVQLDQLRRLSSNRAEDYAVQELQVAASYALDFLTNYQREWSLAIDKGNILTKGWHSRDIKPESLEYCLKPGMSDLGELACQIVSMKRDFHFALISLRGVIEQQRFFQESSKQNWSRFGSLTLLVLIVASILLLLLSRRGLHRQFWTPLQTIVSNSEALLKGFNKEKLPEVGAQEIRLLASEINLIAEALELSREELKTNERQTALAKLVPVIAHNVKNPLASIRANAQLLEASQSRAEINESQIAILTTVDKLTRWINSLVSYLHPVSPRFAPNDFRNVVEEAVGLLSNPAVPKNITIVYENWDESVEIFVDTDLMEQAIFCLLINAIDASPNDGEIRVGFDASSERCLLYIEDDGPGLPFEYRATELKPGPSTKEFGTGLGLPIVQKVCDSHGFTFDFQKSGGKGARAVIYFRKQKRENE